MAGGALRSLARASPPRKERRADGRKLSAMHSRPVIPPPESRAPSLRPLALLVGALAAVWIAAICLILIQL